MSSLNKILYSFFVLIFLSSPLPMMASKQKRHSVHEHTRLHDQQPNRVGRDKQMQAARRKKFVPPPQKVESSQEQQEEEAA